MKQLMWFVLGYSLAGTANAASFQITDAWAQPSVSAEMGAAYVTLQSDAPCTVIAADAPDVTKVTELHSHTMENGVMQMRKIDALKLNANAPEIFAPGGNHLMLIGLKKPLRDGDNFKLTLTSRECGTASTSVSVSKARLQEALKKLTAGSQHDHLVAAHYFSPTFQRQARHNVCAFFAFWRGENHHVTPPASGRARHYAFGFVHHAPHAPG